MDIGRLKREIQRFTLEKKDYFKEIAECRNQRDILNQKVKDYISQVRELREKRDIINQEVKKYKEMRRDISEKLRKQNHKLRELRAKRNALMKEAAIRLPASSIREIIEKLDFEYQTNAMSLEEERKILNKIEELEKKLKLKEVADELHRKFIEEVKKADELREQLDELHQKVVELSAESQKYHEKMIELSRQIEPMKKEADKYHQNIIENKKKIDEITKRIGILKDQLIEAKAEKAARELAEREAALKRKAKEVKENIVGKKRFNLRDLQLMLKGGENVESILLGINNTKTSSADTVDKDK